MDPISYSKASQQEQRIKKFVAEPDAASGLVTVPSTIASGETVSIPAGRTLVHPNMQVGGTLAIDGTLFIPSGGTYTADEVNTTVVKQNGSIVVDTAQNQAIGGVKTFTSSPIAPTPAQGDSSTKLATTAWVQANAVGAKGGGTDKVFFENDQVVTADYTITAGKNAMSAGTITVNNGVTVTVPSGSTWVVL